MAAVTIRPDRVKVTLTADVLRRALDHLHAHGLLRGGYGELGGPCCAIGHVAAVAGTLHAVEDPLVRLWQDWRTTTGIKAAEISTWNDTTATAAQVAEFYRWAISELEAGR
jgi:hypothetical protein